MDSLELNPATRKLLDAYLSSPTHALLLQGAVGAGLLTIADQLASRLTTSAHVTHLLPEKNLIAIDRVRSLYELTRSINHERRVVIIDDVDTMSDDAQNALLKLFEEPVENVHFILTSHYPHEILSTITSRAQKIEVLPVSDAQSRDLIAGFNFEPAKQSQLMFLAKSHPAELLRLAHDSEYFAKQAELVADARSLLTGAKYDRLRLLQRYNERDNARRLLSMCGNLLSFSVLKQKNVDGATSMALIEEVSQALAANGHVRTQLMYLVTKLP